MQVYAYFSSFSIAIRLLRFLSTFISIDFIASYRFIAMEITRVNAVYCYRAWTRSAP